MVAAPDGAVIDGVAKVGLTVTWSVAVYTIAGVDALSVSSTQ